MKLGIVVYSNDSETVWNAFRIANFALAWGDSVKVFMLGKGVEFESSGTDKFDVANQIKNYLDTGSRIYVCGTCLQVRQLKVSDVHTVATLKELHEIVSESDKVLTF